MLVSHQQHFRTGVKAFHMHKDLSGDLIPQLYRFYRLQLALLEFVALVEQYDCRL